MRELLVVLVLWTACASHDTAVPIATRAVSIEATLFPPSTAALLATHGARYLPAETPLLLAVAAPALLARAVELEVDVAHEPFDRAVEALAKWATGLPLRDAADIAGAGLDVHGPWGAAWLEDARVTFARVVDARKLQRRLEAEGLSAQSHGTHRRCDGVRGLWVVARDELAFFVHASACHSEGPAATIAHLPADKGLAAQPRFRRALEQLAFGAHAAAYIQPSIAQRRIQGSIDRATTELRARSELTKLKKRALAKRKDALLRMVKGTEGVALGVELDAANVRLKAFVAGELLAGRSGTSWRELVEGEPPRFAFEGTIDRELFRELFEVLGRDAVEAERALADVDLSVAEDLLPRLDGRVRLRVERHDEDANVPPLTLRLGLQDAREARAFLGEWLGRRRAQPPRSTRALVLSADERVLHVREERRDLWLTIEGDELVIASRSPAAARAKSEAALAADPLVAALGGLEQPHAVLVLDAHFRGFGEPVVNRFGGFGVGRFGLEERFDGPPSPKRSELIDQLLQLSRRQALERETGRARLFTALGHTVLLARAVDGGVVLHGVQRLGEDRTALVAEPLIWALADDTGLSDTGRQITAVERELARLSR